MAQFEQHFVQDLTQQIKVRHCGSIVFNADNESNVVSVRLFNGSEPVAISGSVVGAVVCSDGSTVPLTGSYSGNTASITLTGDCFAVLGQIGVGIQIVNGTQKTTVLKVIYNVETLTTENVVDPGSRITLEVGDLIAAIDKAVATIPEDYSALTSEVEDIKAVNKIFNRDVVGVPNPIDTAAWIDNANLNDSGAVKAAQGWKVTQGYIETSADSYKISYNNSETSYIVQVAGYTSNGSFVRMFANAGSSSGVRSFTIDTTSVDKIRIATRYGNPILSVYPNDGKIVEKLASVEDDVSDLKSAVINNGLIIDVSNYILYEHAYIDTNGINRTNPNAPFTVSQYFTIADYADYIVCFTKSWASSAAYNIGLFNASKAFVGVYGEKGTSAPINVSALSGVSNAVYFAVCENTGSDAYLYKSSHINQYMGVIDSNNSAYILQNTLNIRGNISCIVPGNMYTTITNIPTGASGTALFSSYALSNQIGMQIFIASNKMWYRSFTTSTFNAWMLVGDDPNAFFIVGTINASNYSTLLPDANTNKNGAYILQGDCLSLVQHLPTYISGTSLLLIYQNNSNTSTPGIQLLITPSEAFVRSFVPGSNVYNSWNCLTSKELTLGENDNIIQALRTSGRLNFLIQGNHNLIDEYKAVFGNTFFEDYTDYNGYGTDCVGKYLKFSPAWKITCNYTGNNDAVKNTFAPFNCNSGSLYINGLNMEASNVRYCIHDDKYNATGYSETIIENCNLKITNAVGKTQAVIGGGLGINSNIVVQNVIADSTNAGNTGIINYHNKTDSTANAMGQVTIKDCYCKTGTIRIASAGTHSEHSRAIVTNNSVTAEPYHDYTGDAVQENIDLLKWNNTVRN